MTRRWLFWLLAIAFACIVASHISDIKQLLQILRQGQWQWVFIAAVLQVVYFVVYATLYQYAFRAVGVLTHLKQLLPVVFASYFVDVAAPSGGLSIVALFADDAAQHGRSPVKTTAGVLLAHAGQFATSSVSCFLD